MLPSPYDQLYRELNAFIPDSRLITDPLRTLAYGTDASFYRLIPKLVVKTENEAETSRILALASRLKTPVTFRAAGTSLSGQAISDSVLLMLGDGWRGYSINEEASEIRLQPGVIGGNANKYLAPYKRKIGPDPASINAAMVGGIAANNASGMCCGTAQNSYQTLRSMRLVFADGTVLDTSEPASRSAFRRTRGELLRRLDDLARRTKQDKALAKRIRSKFQIKNTTGYSLNALVDFDDPIEVLQHLMIGSEGTLGFLSEITYQTVAEQDDKASALILFPDVETACRAVALLKRCPVAAVELMDRAALRSVEDNPGIPNYFKELSKGAAALLVETRVTDKAALAQQVGEITEALATIEVLYPVQFTAKEAEYTALWNIRKGLFPSIGAMRETGTTVIIEDVVFSVPKLAAATLDLQALFEKHGYTGAIIFGHALEGNLHFVFTQDFGVDAEVERYRRFMDDVCDMVVEKYDGSLKGEHSTGRNMAPFVAKEWGPQAFGLMREIKDIFDPQRILNPGVILNEDAEAHVKDLKTLFPADPLIDKCIECGFCEPNCPSRALTLSPRQRIVGLREIARLKATGENPQRESTLRKAFQYQGVETCAGDSLCSLACPVNIDTGKMMKALRSQGVGTTANKVAGWVAGSFGAVAKTTRLSLGGANLTHKVLGSGMMQRLSSGARKLSGDRIPLWNPYMPTPAKGLAEVQSNSSNGEPIVYFPSCASRTMGPALGDPETEALTNKTEALFSKGGYDVIYPPNCESLCCGMPFESKGMNSQAQEMQQKAEKALREASHEGEYPVVFDTSPCAYRMLRHCNQDMRLFDITEFIHDHLMQRLSFRRTAETVAIHATCSTHKMNLNDKLKAIAEACVENVIVPDGVTCCGWAGDKGFTRPELNASAVRYLRPALPDECQSGYSTSRTCEIGLSFHSGRYYRSIVYLVDKCTQPVSRA